MDVIGGSVNWWRESGNHSPKILFGSLKLNANTCRINVLTLCSRYTLQLSDDGWLGAGAAVGARFYVNKDNIRNNGRKISAKVTIRLEYTLHKKSVC